MDVATLISRVRKEIGDPAQPFRDLVQMDGNTSWLDLSKEHIVNDQTFTVTTIIGSDVEDLTPDDYTIDFDLGQLTLEVTPSINTSVIVNGFAYGMYSDTELIDYIRDGVYWHTYNRTVTQRYRDRNGFITYRETPIQLSNLPAIEEPLVVMRCVLQVFWALANDAATDPNIQTAEGTNIDRTSRYHQLMSQIEAMTDRYRHDCGTLNVGPDRMETMVQRRVSQSTGRLVPIYSEREYDDHRYPQRQLPPIDKHYEDDSGVPSQLWLGSTI